MDAQRTVRAIPATAVLVLATAAAAGLGYVWTLLAGRLLDPYEYSDFSAGVSMIYFSVTALAPLWQTVAAFTARQGVGGALARRMLTLLGIGGAFLVLATAAFSTPLARLLRLRSGADCILISLAIVMVGLLHVRRGVQLGERHFAAYSWNVTIDALLRVIVAVALLRATHNASWGLGSCVISLGAALLVAGRLPAKGSANVDLREVGRYFVPIFIYSAVYAGFQNLDVVLVKQWFPAANAGVYGAASFLARGVGMLVMPFYAFAVPHLAEVASDPHEVRRRFIRICAQYAALASVALLVLAAGSRLIVIHLFGVAYAEAAPLLLPLGAAIALGGLAFLFGQLPLALNRFGFIAAYAPALALEVTLLACFHSSLPKVALTLIAANVVTLLAMLPFLRPSLGSRTPAAGYSG